MLNTSAGRIVPRFIFWNIITPKISQIKKWHRKFLVNLREIREFPLFYTFEQGWAWDVPRVPGDLSPRESQSRDVPEICVPVPSVPEPSVPVPVPGTARNSCPSPNPSPTSPKGLFHKKNELNFEKFLWVNFLLTNHEPKLRSICFWKRRKSLKLTSPG